MHGVGSLQNKRLHAVIAHLLMTLSLGMGIEAGIARGCERVVLVDTTLAG
jgi:hypothetical protein